MNQSSDGECDSCEEIQSKIDEYKQHIKDGNKSYLYKLAQLYEAEAPKKSRIYYLTTVEMGNYDTYYELAEKYYLKAIEHGVCDKCEIFHTLAKMYERINRNQEMEEYYLKLIEIETDKSKLFHDLAFVYDYYRSDYSKAEEYYLKAIDSGFKDSYNCIANMYAEGMKDYKKAEEFYLKGIEQGCTYIYHSLAVLYHKKMHEYDKARYAYKKAIRAGCKESSYCLAQMCEELGQCQLAEGYYLKAIKNNPFNQYEIYIALANICHLDIEYNQKAEYYCIEAIKISDKVEALLLLMNIYTSLLYNRINTFSLANSNEFRNQIMTAKEKHLTILAIYRKYDSDYENIIKLYQIFHNHRRSLDLSDDSLVDSYIKWKTEGTKSNNRNFQILMNRIRLATEEKCGVCRDTKNCVAFECCHKVCVYCYLKVMNERRSCPFCRMRLNS